jgi:hypothetical protein
MTDTLRDLGAGLWSLRYVLLFVASLTATAFALEYRRKWHDAVGLLKVYVDELRIADRYGKTLEARLAAEFIKGSVVLDTTDDDPVFDQGYVYDRIPTWVPADVPGSPQEPRRVPR